MSYVLTYAFCLECLLVSVGWIWYNMRYEFLFTGMAESRPRRNWFRVGARKRETPLLRREWGSLIA